MSGVVRPEDQAGRRGPVGPEHAGGMEPSNGNTAEEEVDGSLPSDARPILCGHVEQDRNGEDRAITQPPRAGTAPKLLLTHEAAQRRKRTERDLFQL